MAIAVKSLNINDGALTKGIGPELACPDPNPGPTIHYLYDTGKKTDIFCSLFSCL